MSDFENALRGTMSHKNNAFEQVDADLRAETNTASVGIECGPPGVDPSDSRNCR